MKRIVLKVIKSIFMKTELSMGLSRLLPQEGPEIKKTKKNTKISP